MADVQTPSRPSFAGRLRTKSKLLCQYLCQLGVGSNKVEYTDVGQQITDVLITETMLVLTVVYASGQITGPILQLVITLETVLPPPHHCVASGGRHVSELATDCP